MWENQYKKNNKLKIKIKDVQMFIIENVQGKKNISKKH